MMARGRSSDQPEVDSDEPDGTVPVVGVGASAGGLDAFSELLSRMPPHPGLAMVLVMHLQPTHPSDLPAILGRKTSLPVVQAESGMSIEADHVYVIPPNVEMRVGEDVFVLSPRPETATPSMTVDILLSSLAERYGSRAIGVVLSGSASDGTKGLAAIKDENGITIVQDPATAGHRGMPDSAIAAGVADMVLPIEGIAQELVRLAEHPYVRSPRRDPEDDVRSLTAAEEEVLSEVIARVKRATGLDLSHYKRPTLLRRIERRMVMQRAGDLPQYLDLLNEDPSETAELLNDALVRVTSFFRDPEAFEALKTQVLPSAWSQARDEPIRAWVAGCATGQEAYSIAIVLLEHLAEIGSEAPIQVFASDLREADLEVARRGVYPPEIETEVTAERLTRFFTKVEDGFQISKSIREACVFARHDVTSDPPFAKLQLVSCRNLLIYVDRALQKRLLSIFHYALLPDGVLMLGHSEGAGAAPGLFKRAEHRGIFTRLPGETPRVPFGEALFGLEGHASKIVAAVPEESWREAEWSDAQRRFDELLLERYSPAAVLIDERLRVKQIRGEAGEYLRFKPGDATLDLVGMVSDGLASAIIAAVAKAEETQRLARSQVVQPREGGGHVSVEIVVVPVVADDQPASYAVFFNEGDTVSRADGETGPEPTESEYLRQELEAATQRLSILRHGRDSANEALRAANEEIQSSNEELQSMNEELETAKEELQSTNEELATLNDELQARNVELGLRNDDLNNLLSSASIAMLVLDADLGIRSYTVEAARAFNLIPGDVGRRVTDIRWRYSLEDVEDKLKTVIETAEPLEYEVTDESGCWFRLSLKPYVTGEGGIRGAVLTLLDIDVLRRAQTSLDKLVVDRTAELGITLAQLEDAQGVKDSFLAHMSHELRTPLNSIIGFSQILLDGIAGKINPEQQRQLGMIHASGKHLLAIVSDLLDLERIEAGAMPVTAKPFDLATVCRKVCELLGPVADAKGIELRTAAAAERSIDLVSDELKTEQILLNLVDNAIKFTESGHVAVDAHATDDTCVITVADTGRGMTPEQLEQAFEEFQRVRDDAADMVPGTGLGLSIAVRLAGLLGGTVKASSTPGVGSTFTVTIARYMEPDGEDQPSSS